MAFEKAITIGDREVTVNELTVAEVRDMAKAVATNTSDPLSNWLIEDAPLGIMAAMSSVDEKEFDSWRPSEIKQLLDACQEVNPDFFDMNRRMTAAVETMRSLPSTALSQG